MTFSCPVLATEEGNALPVSIPSSLNHRNGPIIKKPMIVTRISKTRVNISVMFDSIHQLKRKQYMSLFNYQHFKRQNRVEESYMTNGLPPHARA